MGEHTIIYQPQIIRETAEGLNRLDIRDEMLSRRELGAPRVCGDDPHID